MYYRKYEVNEGFFDTWSRDMAYVLGFIVADGHITKNCLSIEIQDSDLDVLRYIKDSMKSTHPITVNPKRVRLRINSVKMCNSLFRKFSLRGNKTFNYGISYTVPDLFVGDFIRGFFDGDGWVYNRRNSLGSGFCSASKTLLEDVWRIIGKIGKIREKLDRRIGRKPLYMLEMNMTHSLVLRDVMYNEEQFCLLRKKEKFWNFHTPSSRWWTTEQTNFLLEHQNQSLSWLSQQVGKSYKAVQLKIMRLRKRP